MDILKRVIFEMADTEILKVDNEINYLFSEEILYNLLYGRMKVNREIRDARDDYGEYMDAVLEEADCYGSYIDHSKHDRELKAIMEKVYAKEKEVSITPDNIVQAYLQYVKDHETMDDFLKFLRTKKGNDVYDVIWFNVDCESNTPCEKDRASEDKILNEVFLKVTNFVNKSIGHFGEWVVDEQLNKK